MALSEFYADTIIEVRVAFGFSGFDVEPNEISRALGILPDEVRRKGEKRTIRDGRSIEAPFSSWSIRSQINSKDVNEHLWDVLRRVQEKQSAWRAYFGTPTFYVTWKGNYLYQGSGPFYEADVIAGIASWRAELVQDIYQIDDDSGIRPIGPEGLMRLPKRFFRTGSPE